MYPEKKLSYPICPKCKQSAYMQRDGKNPKSLSQRYHCTKCKLTYTPDRTIKGYSSDVRYNAIQLCHIMSVTQVARVLGVSRSSVQNWWDSEVGLHNVGSGKFR